MKRFLFLVTLLTFWSNALFSRETISGSMLCEVAYNKVVSTDSGSPAELPNNDGKLGSSRILEFSYAYLKPTKHLGIDLSDGDTTVIGFFIKSISVEPGPFENSVTIKEINSDGFVGEVTLSQTHVALRRFVNGFTSDYLFLGWDQENKWSGLFTSIDAGNRMATMGALKCRDLTGIFDIFVSEVMVQ